MDRLEAEKHQMDALFYYAKAALVGFLTGNAAFVLIVLATGTNSFFRELRVYFPSVAGGILLSLAAAYANNWLLNRGHLLKRSSHG